MTPFYLLLHQYVIEQNPVTKSSLRNCIESRIREEVKDDKLASEILSMILKLH